MFIDGKWEGAASGRTFDSHNPATGEKVGQVADAERADLFSRGRVRRRSADAAPSHFPSMNNKGALLLSGSSGPCGLSGLDRPVRPARTSRSTRSTESAR